MSEVNTKPPIGARESAERGLELRREHGRGGTAVGVARARDISDGDSLSRETIGRMVSFFARHQGNDRSDKTGAAYISWLLWGGDAGKRWADRKLKEFEAKTSNVAAMAGISAAEREIVETVRVHILPMQVTEFVTESGDSLMVGGPDLVPDYHAGIVADMDARGDTYIPQLIEHSGAAVGMVRTAELDDDGISLIVDLWSEGVDARFGRDFVSAYWQFGDIGEDGRPMTARIIESSFTPTPQFSLAQKPVSELDTINAETSALFPIAATMRIALPTQESTMTAEEMLEQLLTLDGFAEAIREVVRTEMDAEPEPEPEPEAEAMMMDGDEEHADEEHAEASDGADQDDGDDSSESVAASTIRSLDAIADRLERLEKANAVKAGLRGQQATMPTTSTPDDVPKEIGARVLHYIKNEGLSRAAAVKAAQNYKGA